MKYNLTNSTRREGQTGLTNFSEVNYLGVSPRNIRARKTFLLHLPTGVLRLPSTYIHCRNPGPHWLASTLKNTHTHMHTDRGEMPRFASTTIVRKGKGLKDDVTY